MTPKAGLLTGGLQVRVLPEEPILSTTYTDELDRLTTFDHKLDRKLIANLASEASKISLATTSSLPR